MNKVEEFKAEVKDRVAAYQTNQPLRDSAHEFMRESIIANYSYNFSWLGRPVIQYPQDMVALQEVIFNTKPDLIIETGIAHGGSLIFSASMLKLIGTGNELVLGVDIDIREHNRAEIENHFLYKQGLIKMIQGSSIAADIVDQVKDISRKFQRVMVILDSNHTHEHVLEELRLYSPLVTSGMYLVTLDTMVEDFDDELFSEKKWGKGDNPKTAVHEFLKGNSDFSIDETYNNKLLISVGPDGYLKRK